MACLSLGFIEQLLVWLIVIGAVIAIVRLLVPFALGPLGQPGSTLLAALNIIIWAIVAIAIVIIVFDLLACVIGMPRLR
jgi:hypothetical protein